MCLKNMTIFIFIMGVQMVVGVYFQATEKAGNASIAFPADPFYDSLHDHPSTLLRCAWYYVVIPCLRYLFRDHGCPYAGSGNEKNEPADTGAETRIASCSMPLD